VRRGLADDSLLDTYYEERAPHVRAIIARAVQAGRIIQTTDPAVAAGRDAMFLAPSEKEVVIGDAGGALELKMPSLSGGVLDASSGVAGDLFPQPFVTLAGREMRLDDLYGGRFAIVAGANAEHLFTDKVRAAWAELGAWFVEVSDEQITRPWPVVREQGSQL